MANPNISFIFPVAWLKKDVRPYLDKNLQNQIRRNQAKIYYEPEKLPGLAPTYSRYIGVLKTRAWQPVKIPISKSEFETVLKKTLPEATLVRLDTLFVQNNNAGGLPVMELELYFF